MNNLSKFLKEECSGWKKWEVIWLIFANLIILGVSAYLGDNALGIITSMTGVTCVILVGKGKMSNYIFGTVNVLLYALTAWKARYYGDVMLNLLYYFPTNIIGWFVWMRHVDKESNEVYKERMTVKQDIIVTLISIIGIFAYSYILKLLGGNLPLVDSMSTVLSIVAQILMIKRYTEQWIVWIVVDVVSVIMWIAALFGEGQSIAVLMMWAVYLANAIIMFVKWYKESKK
ncbi:nicotinamide riboside transporter PnuC [Falcatimonas sp. MSJ-15]|uniref:nicotinamide riboside transporter PnuC n=1 Tax=Falcatimonas sp. MSJ-15 TaxID=2841515 RepID=UPI001C102B5E|nr:nicotinamide riboside transporter PnuC [Falcatimonas sp. MSJ-15]MBU5471146.1 nicotinamide riboside transporter PnuC [Falcatimonas sp. MSJ-15]